MAREYKDSGIEWIGRIPKGWIVKRLKQVCDFRNGYTPSKENPSFWRNGTIPWFRMDDIRDSGRKLSVAKQYITEDAVKGNGLFKAGSFILATTATIGEHALLTVDSLANQRFTNLKICESLKNSMLVEFFFYYLFVIDEQCKTTTNSATFAAVNMKDLGNMGVTIPPLAEQRAIASYLDRKCAEIDSLVELQEQMIAQLTDYKQSVITEAVTKGLNPEAELVSSGIDWIGDVPKGWKIARIKNVASLYGRIGFRGYTSDDLNKDGEGAITLSPSNMLPMGMDYSNVTYLSWAKYFESPEIIIQNNDLLMVKTGSSYGKVAYVDNLPKEATINPQILRIVSKISSKYLGYFMQTPIFLYQVEGGVVGGTIPTIAQEKISNFKILLPSENEQNDIVSHLDTKCREIDTLISLKRQKIEMLKEYKKSIIFEAVTGKTNID